MDLVTLEVENRRISQIDDLPVYKEVVGWPKLLTPQVVQWFHGNDSIEPLTEYWNSERQKFYKPHTRAELAWVLNVEHRRLAAFGGEGAGKTVVGIIRDLERAKHGCSGVLTSPDFEHFKSSFWLELQRWIPWHFIVERHRYKESREWEPAKPFWIVFETGARFQLGGMKEDRVEKWEGPNINFWHFDEARRHKEPKGIKIIEGRVRIPGPITEDYPGGMPPQWWITTTPRKHWLYHYYGPWHSEEPDPREAFKSKMNFIRMPVEDNRENLYDGYVEERGQVLTEAEKRVLLDAEWEDIEDTEFFLPSMTLWDLCEEALPPLTKNEPMVIAWDAAKGRIQGIADCFGMLGVTRHPSRHNDIAVRMAMKWQTRSGHKMDYNAEDGPVEILRSICKDYDVVQVAYDPYQLHFLATELNKEKLAWFKEFSQGSKRLESDRQLLDLILERRIAHNGDVNLREHIQNSNRKLDPDGRRLRIVKREDALKNDLAVCLSMASYECLRLNL